jgi:hypothetical protein
MLKEFEAIKGRTPGSDLMVSEVDSETWLGTKPY